MSVCRSDDGEPISECGDLVRQRIGQNSRQNCESDKIKLTAGASYVLWLEKNANHFACCASNLSEQRVFAARYEPHNRGNRNDDVPVVESHV